GLCHRESACVVLLHLHRIARVPFGAWSRGADPFHRSGVADRGSGETARVDHVDNLLLALYGSLVDWALCGTTQGSLAIDSRIPALTGGVIIRARIPARFDSHIGVPERISFLR